MNAWLNPVKQLLPSRLRRAIKARLFGVQDFEARLMNHRAAGFKCQAAVDGGAHAGRWTQMFWRCFPEAPSVMVEPLPGMRRHLEALSLQVPGSRACNVALGKSDGQARLHLGDTNSYLRKDGSAEEGAETIEVPVMSLDSLLLQCGPLAPNLLKLDLQGFELECLSGCADLARVFEVVILEVSVLPIGGVPRFTELDRHLEDRGFRLYDLVPQYYRPLDDALWQCDAFYVRHDSSLIQSMAWA